MTMNQTIDKITLMYINKALQLFCALIVLFVAVEIIWEEFF